MSTKKPSLKFSENAVTIENLNRQNKVRKAYTSECQRWVPRQCWASWFDRDWPQWQLARIGHYPFERWGTCHWRDSPWKTERKIRHWNVQLPLPTFSGVLLLYNSQCNASEEISTHFSDTAIDDSFRVFTEYYFNDKMVAVEVNKNESTFDKR